jgi:hypothetical protein
MSRESSHAMVPTVTGWSSRFLGGIKWTVCIELCYIQLIREIGHSYAHPRLAER